jgi:xanthine dehydrogenase YagS FAD-binding subunit
VVLGAAAPIPWRAAEAEAALTGQPLGEAAARAAAKAAMKGATPLSGNAYKVPLFETVVRRTILAAMNEKEEAR